MIKRITEETTLGELALEAAKRGITNIAITPRYHEEGYVAELTYKTSDRWLVGKGVTIARALDDAFQLLEAKEMESFR